MMFLKTLFKKIKKIWRIYDDTAKAKLSDTLEWEALELENIFGLLVLGSLVGLPSPPMQITLDLLPHMERELLIMLHKVDTASAPLSDLLSIFDIG